VAGSLRAKHNHIDICFRIRQWPLCKRSGCHWLSAPQGLEIGIVGGSISACHFKSKSSDMLPAGTCYPEVLSQWLSATVHNRAVAATGCSHASLCLDVLVPPTARFILIEYASNDAAALANPSKEISRDLVDGQLLDPRSSMERLLRRISRTRPHVTPIIVYACSPHVQHFSAKAGTPCEHIYDALVERYGVITATLPTKLPDIKWDTFLAHPDARGHTLLAAAVASAIWEALPATPGPYAPPNLLGRAPRPIVSMPYTRYQSAEWEDVERSWFCDACSWDGCGQIQPIRVNNFQVHAVQRSTRPRDAAAASSPYGAAQFPNGWLPGLPIN
jgi:hypothetical protein